MYTHTHTHTHTQERRQAEACADEFVDLQMVGGGGGYVSDGEMSRAINERQMDVLVDLVGLIRNHRHAILILRPAPLQVNTVYDKYTHTHTHTHTRARALSLSLLSLSLSQAAS